MSNLSKITAAVFATVSVNEARRNLGTAHLEQDLTGEAWTRLTGAGPARTHRG